MLAICAVSHDGFVADFGLAVSIAAVVIGVSVAAITFLYTCVRVVGEWLGAFPARDRSSDRVRTVMLISLGWASVGFLAAALSSLTFRRGRQLRSLGRVLLPTVVESDTWADPHTHDVASVDDENRWALAAHWRDNGRTEHASVAAFARLTLDLLSLGAPPALVASAQRDALDEIRHAELCFGLARALDGRCESPGAFPEANRARTVIGTRTMKLALLAVDSLVDGAFHEGISARVLSRLSTRCEIASITLLLRTLARDEGRHAAHGWDVVEWCIAEGGHPVIEALRRAVHALPTDSASHLPSGARDGGWERFGVHGERLEQYEHAAARAWITAKVSALRHPSVAA